MNKKISVKEETSLPEPFLKYIYEKDAKTGKEVIKSIKLSDGTTIDDADYLQKVLAVFKKATGSDNIEIAERIISKIAWGMSADDNEDRKQLIHMLLPSLNPQDESEAMLLGQFLVLQDSAMNCMRNANCNEMFCHKKELFQIGVKLFRSANETIQTLLKYRSGGKQQIQVIHVSGDGKAVIANEMSTGGGSERKK